MIAYLSAALGPSGEGELCGDPPSGAHQAIDHIVLSHPHFDHASALDTVLHCYDVKQFWDAGRINEAKFYRELISAIAHGAAHRRARRRLPGPRRDGRRSRPGRLRLVDHHDRAAIQA